MGKKTVLELYARAIREARFHRSPHLAQDFASWYIVQILEGKRQHQTFKQAWIDYVRDLTQYNHHKKTKPTFVEFDEKRIPKKDIELEFKLVRDVSLSSRELLVLVLYYYHGWSQVEIGQFFGITDTRVSQIQKKVLSKLRLSLEAL